MSSIELFLETSKPSGLLDVPFEESSNGQDIRAVSVVPIAAHQEDVRPLVDLYEQQVGTQKWQAFLYLNAPSTAKYSHILEANLEFLQSHGNELGQQGELKFGLRLYEWDGSDGEFSIGTVRKDAWIYALENLLKAGTPESTIGFSHDADMVDISSRYFTEAALSATKSPAHFLVSRCNWGIRNNELGATVSVPAINRLATYMVASEEAFRLATIVNYMWDCAVGFRLDSYAKSGGYRAGSRHTETQPIIESIKGLSNDMNLFLCLDSEFIVTSMRRYIHRAAKGESPFSQTDFSITHKDDVRNSFPINEAEKNTRKYFSEWCNQADENNIALIIKKFTPVDGNDIGVRVDFYEQLVNLVRDMMKKMTDRLNSTPGEARKASAEIVEMLNVYANKVLRQDSSE